MSNANEFDEDVKEEMEAKKAFRFNDTNDVDVPVVGVGKPEFIPPALEPSKIDFSGNQENCDAVEDCINLNVEDEENFEEVRCL